MRLFAVKTSPILRLFSLLLESVDPLREDNNNNNELYLHDHTNTYSIAKAMFRNQNYNTGQLRYFDDNLSRTSKQAEIYFMNCVLIK